MKRVNEEYTKRKVKVYWLGLEDEKKQINWMEAVGVGSITKSVPLQNEDEIRRDFPEIREGAVKRPAGAAGLLISITERQLHSQGGVEKGKLCLSPTPLGCGQVWTGVAPRGEKSQGGEEVSAECKALQAATTTQREQSEGWPPQGQGNQGLEEPSEIRWAIQPQAAHHRSVRPER